MAQKKSKERPEEPLGTMSYQTSSKRSPPFWLLIGARKTQVFEDELTYKVSTLIMVGHFLSAMISNKWKFNLGLGTQKKCPFLLKRGVPSIEVIDANIMWAFFWDQILCPLNGGVPRIEVSQRKGSTVGGNHRWVPLTYFRCSYFSLISFFILFLSLFFLSGLSSLFWFCCCCCFGWIHL